MGLRQRDSGRLQAARVASDLPRVASECRLTVLLMVSNSALHVRALYLDV